MPYIFSVRDYINKMSSHSGAINLNTAGEDDIAKLPGVEYLDAMEILRRRPFKSWEHLKATLDWEPGLVEQLQKLGVSVG